MMPRRNGTEDVVIQLTFCLEWSEKVVVADSETATSAAIDGRDASGGGQGDGPKLGKPVPQGGFEIAHLFRRQVIQRLLLPKRDTGQPCHENTSTAAALQRVKHPRNGNGGVFGNELHRNRFRVPDSGAILHVQVEGKALSSFLRISIPALGNKCQTSVGKEPD